jgi:hypothetical protein
MIDASSFKSSTIIVCYNLKLSTIILPEVDFQGASLRWDEDKGRCDLHLAHAEALLEFCFAFANLTGLLCL